MERKIDYSRINVRLLNLGDCGVNGFTTYVIGDDGDVYYTIFINSELCEAKRQATLQHELDHIERDDFHSAIHASQLEALAHQFSA